MKLHTKNGFAYFYDRTIKLWTLYPIDSEGNRIEWDANDNPIECEYFVTLAEVKSRINQ
jgi:hypothetical protein